MAIASRVVVIFESGANKFVNSKDLELIFKSVSVSVDGVDNGMNITEVGGEFDFNAKNVTNIGTVDGVDISGHAARHISAGADEIDGDQLDIDWNPTNYTPTTSPTEVTSLDHLTAHLAGIDTALGAIVATDELVKVSANDTTPGYLLGKITTAAESNTTNAIELKEVGDGTDEDLKIAFDESKINHDNLLGFVANEHVDHSAVSVLAGGDDGLLAAQNDLTSNIGLKVDITNTTAETVVVDTDTILMDDGDAGVLKKITRSNFIGSATITMGSGIGIVLSSGAEVTGLPATPSGATAAASKAYVDSTVISAGTLREAVLHCDQLDDVDGINAAMAAWIAVNPAISDTFILTDGTTTETYTFKAAEAVPFDVEIGGTPALTMGFLAAAITADSAVWDSVFEAALLDSMNADGVVAIIEKASAAGASTSRIYGVIANAQSDIQVVAYNGLIEYSATAPAADLPAADPAAVRFGFRREEVALTNGEIHLCRSHDSLYAYDGDSGGWITISADAIPFGTSGSGGAVKGKVTADSDKGLLITSGIMEVKVDATTIGFTTGSLQVINNSIDENKLTTSVAGDGIAGGNGTALSADTDNASTQIVAAKIAVKHTVTAANNTGGTINPGTLVYLKNVAGALEMEVADADTAGAELFLLGYVEDAAIIDTASGEVVAKPGALLTGLSSLVTGQKVYTAPAAGTGTATAPSGTGQHVWRLGYATSATTAIYMPEHEGQFA